MHNTGQTVDGSEGLQDIDINGPEAWAIELGNDDVTIAIFDNGLVDHADLVDQEGVSRIIQGYSCADPENLGNFPFGVPWNVNHAHGMQCAGIASASHNDIGIRGVAPGVKLVSINYYNAVGSEMHAEGFLWGMDNGVDIFSNSYKLASCGAWEVPVIDDAISEVSEFGRNGLGCLVVFASGNDNNDPDVDNPCVSYPANHPEVLSVGAVLNNGIMANYSSYGQGLGVIGPSGGPATLDGVEGGVVTLDRPGEDGVGNGDYSLDFNGTSAACPLVSGIAALLLSKDPNLYQSEIKNLIYSSAQDYGSPGYDIVSGYGLAKADAALILCMNDPCEDEGLFDYMGVHNYDLPGSPGFYFSDDASFQAGFTVKDGTSVTFSDCTIALGEDARIVIEPNASLNLENVVITSACERMWEGIEVWRSSEFVYGELSTIGCEIRDAHIAVVAGKRAETMVYDPEFPYWDHGYWEFGGKISCDGTDFINCGGGILIPGQGDIYSVDGMGQTPFGLTQDCSQLINIVHCKFESDENGLNDPGYSNQSLPVYPNIVAPERPHANFSARMSYGIRTFGVRGAIIQQCDFINVESGIEMHQSRFDVDFCTFLNVTRGIRASGHVFPDIGAYGNFNITNCAFSQVFDPDPNPSYSDYYVPNVECNQMNTCHVEYELESSAAIWMNSIRYFRIESCAIGDDFIGPSQQNIGIYLNESSNFQLLDNYILEFSYGVIAINSDQVCHGNSVIGPTQLNQTANTFENCTQDLILGGDNQYLLWRCNNHDHTSIDANLDPLMVEAYGVLGAQGNEPQGEADANAGAGNRMIPPDENYLKTIAAYPMLEDYSDLELYTSVYNKPYESLIECGCQLDESTYYNLGYVFEYYHHGNDALDNEYQPFDGNTDISIIATDVGFDENLSCDDPFMIIEDDEELQSPSELIDALDSEVSHLHDLEQQVDDYQSQTQTMLDAIYGGIANEHELKEYLKSNSPLSQQVLEAYMLRYNVPEEFFVEVFELNSVLEADLHDLFHARIEDMSGSIQELLESIYLYNPNLESIVSSKRRIAQIERALHHSHEELLKDIIQSGDQQSYLDNVRLIEGAWTDQLEISAQVRSLDFVAAAGLLAALQDDNNVLNNWAGICEFYISNPDETEISDFRSSILSVLGTGQYLSPTEQLMVEGFGWKTPILIPDVNELELEKNTFHWIKTSEQESPFLYPNPASQYVVVDLSTYSKLELSVTMNDLSGKLVYSGMAVPEDKQHLISTLDVIGGSYVITVSHEQVALKSGLLMVNR